MTYLKSNAEMTFGWTREVGREGAAGGEALLMIWAGRYGEI